jgi:hypothetical protein
MDSQPTHDDDEPQTPMWMPVLGVALFLAAGIWWATRPVPLAPAPPPVVPSASAPPPAALSVTVPTPPMPMRPPIRK